MPARLHSRFKKGDSTLRHVFEDFPAAVYICSERAEVTYCNDHAAETWGHSPKNNESADGLTKIYKLRNGQGERISYAESCMAIGLAEKRAFHDEEIIIERPDGTFRTLLVCVNPFPDGPEFAAGTINVMVDITRIKQMEQGLREANENLDQRVRERTRELASAKERAELSEQTKSRLLAVVSHDLRTPLSGVLIAAQAMLAKGDQIPLERRNHLLTHIVECIREQLSFINGLVTLVSCENNAESNFRHGLLLNEIARASAEAIAIQAESKNIGVNLIKDSAEPSVYGDPQLLTHLFTNLLSNAVKFTPPGGRISLAIQSARAEARVLVTDSGVGFTPGQLIEFEKSGPVKQRPGTSGETGTGLGLAIVRQVAARHAARITLESQPGKGACFTVSFPSSHTAGRFPKLRKAPPP